MPVVVLGLARSGEAAARALLERGARVTVLDAADGAAQRARAARLAGAEVALGRVDPADIDGAELVITSPGVPPPSPWLVAARTEGVPVWSEVELAFRLGVEPAIGITGTNGKTTAAQMTAAALTAAGHPAIAAGNVGTPLVEMVGTDDIIVAELSSFQLDTIEEFRVPVAVLLNLAHDHIDWHGDFESYGRAKARIFGNQTAEDLAVVHADPLCGRLAGTGRARQIPFYEHSVPLGGAGVEDGWIVVPQGRVVAVETLANLARPFVADAIAAAAAACALGADPAGVGDGLTGFRPGRHRVEHVATIDGVRFVDDSKATDPHATLAALEGLTDVVLIAGGRDRSHALGDLAAASGTLRAVVALGEAAGTIERIFAPAGVEVLPVGSMDDAVATAIERAKPGDTVLLSPACASLDMFDDYEARGDAFRVAVERYEGSTR